MPDLMAALEASLAAVKQSSGEGADAPKQPKPKRKAPAKRAARPRS